MDLFPWDKSLFETLISLLREMLSKRATPYRLTGLLFPSSPQIVGIPKNWPNSIIYSTKSNSPTYNLPIADNPWNHCGRSSPCRHHMVITKNNPRAYTTYNTSFTTFNFAATNPHHWPPHQSRGKIYYTYFHLRNMPPSFLVTAFLFLQTATTANWSITDLQKVISAAKRERFYGEWFLTLKELILPNHRLHISKFVFSLCVKWLYLY